MKQHKVPWLEASEAIGLLGVNRATLYAYVSRGHIRSEPMVGGSRRRRYSRDDIERLIARTRDRRHPEQAAERALHWGVPVLESGITLIADGRIYYRGRAVSVLAHSGSIAEVAALLWSGTTDRGALNAAPPASLAPPRVKPGTPFIAAAQATLALGAAHDSLAYDLRPRAVAQTGWRILWELTAVAGGAGKPCVTIDATLAQGWRAPRYAELIRAALIFSADHELNVSAFTARCVASAGSSPYGVVIAGLAALEGAKHGGTTARIEALWDALRRSRDLRGAVAERLRRGELVDGFGHPLYQYGDPRAKALLAMLPKGKEATFAHAFALAAHSVLGEAPTLDFALVAVARVLGLPTGAALTLFAIGRTIGWIGHAIEQYEKNDIIRPRAKYVGVLPSLTEDQTLADLT